MLVIAGGVQPNGRRETSPSPSLRERQRYARTQSMPLVAPLSQQTASQQGQKTQSHQRHQSSPSQDSFKSAPTYKDIGVQDDDSELPHLLSSTHPPLLQSHSYTLPQTSQQQQQQGRYPQPQPTRVHPPQFITRLQDESKVWHMTTELFNDIERADLQQQAIQQRQSPPAPGTEGVAYAGGAGGSSYRYVNSQKQANEKTRNQEGGSGGSNGSAGRNQAQNRERGRDVARDASQNTLARNARGGSRPLTPEARPGSPAYYAQAQTQAPTPPVATRRGTTGSPPTAAAPTTVYNNSNNSNNNANNNAPSPRPLKNRTPDRSLPVQEEPDDHENGHSVTAGIGLQRRASPVPSSDLSASNDLRTSPRQGKDQEATLIDLGPDTDDAHHTDRQSQQIVKKLSDEDDAELSYTPRSPSAALPEPGSLLPDGSRGIHEVLDSKGTTVNDQNAFNATAFEQTMKKLQADMGEHAGHRQNQPPLSSRNDSRTSWYTSWLPDYYHQAYADDREFMDDMAYFTQYIQTPISTNSRPGAPVPPTPHSQSGTRSPMPHQPLQPMPRSLIPPFSPAPPSGTPYPYPFSHLRRNYAYPARVSRLATPATAGAGPTYEPTLEEQLEYHMRIYAMNNGGAVTDSTLSPSSTPYPGMGQNYHPFSAFLAQARNRAAFLGGNGGDEHISVSRRSSPSHEPVAFPPPNFRGRGLKKRSRFALRNGNGNGTNGRTRINPPPRVESTQPKDTSPEPSSGEETAGGDYVAQIQQNGEWVNDDNSPNGVRQHEDEGEDEWIDEDSGDEDSFLGLEYHPTYINNMLRRRKRWEQKWKDLVSAVSVFLRFSCLLSILTHATLVPSIGSTDRYDNGFTGGALAQRLSILGYITFYPA